MVDVFDIYNKMERNNILLSFKGEITSDLLTSILQVMENKMENMQEEPKMKKKVYNVLVECLQNLYHHLDDSSNFTGDINRSAIFMIGKIDGKYSIFTVPKADNWEVILYKTIDNWGNPENWSETNVAVRTNVKPVFLDHKVESLTLTIGNVTNDGAQLELSWENTLVAMKFEVPTQKTAIANINKVLAGPGAADFFAAGQYFYQSNGDMNKALEYVNKAVSLTKEGEEVPFWYLRQKSLIQAKLGDKVGAIATAKLSLAAAEKAKNDDYVKMNKDSIAEWSKK
jgi:tetratricopeptide (TPR) repeat protein